MATVILVDQTGAETEVSNTRTFVNLVYGQGYQPKTGSVGDAYQILIDGLVSPSDPLLAHIRLLDLVDPAGAVAQAILDNLESAASVNPTGHWDFEFAPTVNGTALGTGGGGGGSGTITSVNGDAGPVVVLDADDVSATQRFTFNPGSPGGGNRQWFRLLTMDGVTGTSGSAAQFLLSGTGDFGDTDRGTLLVHMGQRNADTVQVKAWGFDVENTTDPIQIHTKQISTFVFELWARFSDFNQAHSIHILGQRDSTNITWNLDSATTVQPTGISGPYPIASMSQTAADVAAGTNLATPSTFMKRDSSGGTAATTVSLGPTVAGDDLAVRRDFVDTAVAARLAATEKGANNGLATLDAGGKVPQAQIPSVALTEFLGAVASQAAMLALVGQRGDWATRTDLGTDFQLIADDPTTLASWRQMTYPGSAVSSVAGRTGAVTLSKTDVGLANVDNTSDAAKPLSTAATSALAGKAASTHTHVITQIVATGTPDDTTYLRGDGTWSPPPQIPLLYAQRSWNPATSSWSARPAVPAGTIVTAYSTLYPLATAPPGALTQDVWYHYIDTTTP